MSRSAYARTGASDPIYVWIDDRSFVALMELSWLALDPVSEPRWLRYREHCLQQILIGGQGVLASGLELLGGASDRAHLATCIEAHVSCTEQQGLSHVDNSALCLELTRRRHAEVLDSLPDLELPLAKALCSFVSRFLRRTESEVARGIERDEWSDYFRILYGGS